MYIPFKSHSNEKRSFIKLGLGLGSKQGLKLIDFLKIIA